MFDFALRIFCQISCQLTWDESPHFVEHRGIKDKNSFEIQHFSENMNIF